MARQHGARAARRWAIAGVVAVLVVASGVLVWTVGPPIVAAALTRVVATDETALIVAGDKTASILVPSGWSIQEAVGDGSRITLGSPDGVMSVHFAMSSAADASTTARGMAPGPTGTEIEEPDGDGRRITHAQTTTGDAVVGALNDGTSAVVFVSSPSPAYDAELAHLLDRIEFGP